MGSLFISIRSGHTPRYFRGTSGNEIYQIYIPRSEVILNKKKDDGIFILTSELIRWELVRIIKYLSGVTSVNLIPEEQVLFKNIADISTLDNWLEVWENVDDLLSSVDRANLDRKQVILNTFAFVSKAANV